MTTAILTPKTSAFSKLCVAAIILAAAGGAWASGTLLIDHDGGWATRQARTIPGLCDTPSRAGGLCRDAVASRFGSFDFYIGARRVLIPTSLVGLSYFVAVGLWFAVLGCVPRASRWLWRFTLAGLASSLVVSVILVGVMMVTLPRACPLCLIAHACNGLIVVATVALWRFGREATAMDGATVPMSSNIAAHPRGRMAFWAFAGSAAAALALWLQFDTTLQARRQWRKLSELREVIASLQADSGFVMREFMAQPTVDLPPIQQTGVRLVADTLPIGPKLVIFVDYDVSACACFDHLRDTFIDVSFPGGVDVEYRYAAGLGDAVSSGSSAASSTTASEAVLAVRAAEAARRQGGAIAFDAMHRLLLDSRRDRPGRDYDELARAAGLDVEQFRIDMNSKIVARRVRDDLSLAKRLGVESAPAAFLERRRVPDLCLSSAVFWNAVGQDYASGVAWSSASEAAHR